MATPNTLSLAAGALLVLCLSAGIAYVTATAVAPGAAPEKPLGPATDASEIVPFLDSMERRLTLLEEEVRKNRERSNQALQQAIDLDRRLQQQATAPAPAGAVPSGSRPPTDAFDPAELEEVAKTSANDWRVRMAKQRERFIISQFDVLGDASPEAVQRRTVQARADGLHFATRWKLKKADAERGDAICLDHAKRLAEELGPLLREGLESASISAVREKWKAVNSETDRQIRSLLDEDTWDSYEAVMKVERDAHERLFTRLEQR